MYDELIQVPNPNFARVIHLRRAMTHSMDRGAKERSSDRSRRNRSVCLLRRSLDVLRKEMRLAMINRASECMTKRDEVKEEKNRNKARIEKTAPRGSPCATLRSSKIARNAERMRVAMRDSEGDEEKKRERSAERVGVTGSFDGSTLVQADRRSASVTIDRAGRRMRQRRFKR